MTELRGWQLIQQRIERTLGSKRGDLEQPHSEVETATLRGYIAGLKLAMEIPNILRREAGEGEGEKHG